MTTLAELTRPLTSAEVRDAIYAALAARGASTTTWKPGAVVRTIIAGVALVIAALSRLQADIAKSGFLELSTGAWLTLVARYVYGVERDTGSFATGEVVLDNTGGGVHAGDPGDLIVRTADGKTYRNTAAFAIGALETGVVVPVQAVELGSAGSTGPGTIVLFETTLLGVAVTNPTALVGQDPEEDEGLRERCRAKLGTLSPAGPRDAYSFVAKSARRSDGSSIGVTRVRTIADGIGGVDVYVATGTGDVTGDAGDPDTDLGVIAAAIYEDVEPLGITARVHSATPVAISPTYELWVHDTSSYTNTQIQDLVKERLAEWLATQPIGGRKLAPSDPGRVYLSAIEAIIATTLPGREVRVALTAPAADVELAADEAPVLGTVTVTAIHQVSGDII